MKIERYGNLFAVVDDKIGTLYQTHNLSAAQEFIKKGGLKSEMVDFRDMTHRRQAVRYGRIINY